MSIKIIRNKYITICLTSFSYCAILIGSTISLLLAFSADQWQYNSLVIGIYLALVLGGLVLLFIIGLVIIKTQKHYYIIDSNYIKCYRRGVPTAIFTINQQDIEGLHYTGFKYALLLQIGAGYLMVDYSKVDGEIKPSIRFPYGKTLYGISMSPKQARMVAQTLNKKL